MEIWKDVIGYNQYQVSNYGRIKTTANEATRKERMLKPLKHPKGYVRVALWKEGKCKFILIHRIVAEHFIDNPENKQTINHINGNKIDNNVDNLEWTTYRENMNHAVINRISTCGERNGRSKLTQLEVDEINNSNISQYLLAEKYNVSQGTISRIKNKKGWK